MARKTEHLDHLYSRESGSPSAKRHMSIEKNMTSAVHPYEPQAPEDRQGPHYDNDTPLSSWLRNGNATTKPAFDKSNAWRGGKLRND